MPYYYLKGLSKQRNSLSFEIAPRKKKSQSLRIAVAATAPASLNLAVLRAIKVFFNCSNTVY